MPSDEGYRIESIETDKVGLFRKIIYLVWERSGGDEVLIQIISQIWQNPKKDKSDRDDWIM